MENTNSVFFFLNWKKLGWEYNIPSQLFRAIKTVRTQTGIHGGWRWTLAISRCRGWTEKKRSRSAWDTQQPLSKQNKTQSPNKKNSKKFPKHKSPNKEVNYPRLIPPGWGWGLSHHPAHSILILLHSTPASSILTFLYLTPACSNLTPPFK